MVLARSRLTVAAVTALLVSAFGTVFNLAAADLDQWEPAQVVPHSAGAHTAAFFSTQRGRAVVVYKADRAVWASSLPAGIDKSWERPHQLQVPRTSAVGPVATGSGGGATIFLADKYTKMSPAGDWGAIHTFPYSGQLRPSMALVRPGSGLVAAGATYRSVKAAVKPPHKPWMLSSGLSLGSAQYTELRGLWYDRDGRVHVLVTQDQHPDSKSAASAQQVASEHPIGLYESVLHRRNGALSWGPLRQWRTGVVGDLYDYPGFGYPTTLLSNPEGAITVLWYEVDNVTGQTYLLMRHRDAAGNWSPARQMPVDFRSQVVSSLDNSGTTRLSYLRRVSSTRTSLFTRQMSPDGTLSAPVEVDGPLLIEGFRLDGVAATVGGATLLRWYADTGETPVKERFYRCLPGSGCTKAGTQTYRGDNFMAVTPTGAALVAGVNAVEGCPTSRLCSRRLSPP